MPVVDSGSSYALLVMGIIYGAGFLVGAWLLVRRISRKEKQFHKENQPSENTDTEKSNNI